MLKGLFVTSIKKVSGLAVNFNSEVLMIQDLEGPPLRYSGLMFYSGICTPLASGNEMLNLGLIQAGIAVLSLTPGNSLTVRFLSPAPSAGREWPSSLS